MKNIHVLPTEKASRLFEILKYNPIFDKQNIYSEEYKKLHSYKNKNIYIINDEEIKEGDWVIQVNFEKTNTQLIQCATEFQVKIANDKDGSFTKKKIILTTDQGLINDGVQAITDEFLKWFVKNPNCEEVDVKNPLIANISDFYYKITIPKTTQQIIDEDFSGGLTMGQIIPKEEPKQETQQMYSEEEVENILEHYDTEFKLDTFGYTKPCSFTVKEWFEQFKNK